MNINSIIDIEHFFLFNLSCNCLWRAILQNPIYFTQVVNDNIAIMAK